MPLPILHHHHGDPELDTGHVADHVYHVEQCVSASLIEWYAYARLPGYGPVNFTESPGAEPYAEW